MALRYAVANGNWSNTATWDGGTLPTSADDVFANNFIVTIDGTFTVLTIRNTSNGSPVITAGGQFRFANGGNLTCTASTGIIMGSLTSPLEMTLDRPNTATFNGSILTMANVGSYIVIRHSGTGTLNCNGNYNMNGTTTARSTISLTSVGTLNIVGNLSSSASGGTFVNVIFSAPEATINITGNVTGPTSNSGLTASTIYLIAGTLNIIGNTTANLAPAIYLPGAVKYNQTGNVNGSTNQPAIYNITAASAITVTGTVTSGTGAPAIYSAFALGGNYSSGTYVKVNGNVVNTNNIMAIVAPRVTIGNNTSTWLFQISTGGNRTLSTAGVALGNPATNNVRLGTTYGASGELRGTLAMPTPATVSSGVLTDATTGTLSLTPADFWNYLIASGFTANSIGDRLQNIATVDTTEGQIVSYVI